MSSKTAVVSSSPRGTDSHHKTSDTRFSAQLSSPYTHSGTYLNYHRSLYPEEKNTPTCKKEALYVHIHPFYCIWVYPLQFFTMGGRGLWDGEANTGPPFGLCSRELLVIPIREIEEIPACKYIFTRKIIHQMHRCCGARMHKSRKIISHANGKKSNNDVGYHVFKNCFSRFCDHYQSKKKALLVFRNFRCRT